MDIEYIRNKLKENNGWFQGFYNGVLFSTIGSCSTEGITLEEKRGWKLVGMFESKNFTPINNPNQRSNHTVFWREAPTFYFKSNLWEEKDEWPWLPDLTDTSSKKAIENLIGSGGHGTPSIVRRYVCSCSSSLVECYMDHKNERYLAYCKKCGKISIAFSFETFDIPIRNSLLRSNWEKYICKCNVYNVFIDFAVEFSVDSETATDFSWITIGCECGECGHIESIFSVEIP